MLAAIDDDVTLRNVIFFLRMVAHFGAHYLHSQREKEADPEDLQFADLGKRDRPSRWHKSVVLKHLNS